MRLILVALFLLASVHVNAADYRYLEPTRGVPLVTRGGTTVTTWTKTLADVVVTSTGLGNTLKNTLSGLSGLLLSDGAGAFTATPNYTAKWDSAYSTTTVGKPKWDSVYTSMTIGKPKWDSAYTTLTTYRAKWDSSYTTITANKAKWDSAYTTITTINALTGLVTVNGSGVYSATAPTSFQAAITTGTSAQYYRGDKTMQTLNQAAVSGLTTTSTVTFAGLTTTTLSGALTLTGSSAPSTAEGRIYYNSTDKHFYGWNGTAWARLDN